MTTAYAYTLAALFARTANGPGEYRSAGNRPIGFGGMYEEAEQIAERLRQLSLPAKFVALLWLPPPASPAGYCRAFMAVALAGGVPVPLHPHSTSADVADIAERLQAEALLIPGSADDFKGLVAPGALLLDGATGAVIDQSTVSQKQLKRDRRESERPGELAAIFLTSGSSGKPKGVMLSHANLLSNVEAIQAGIGLTAEDRVLIAKSFGYSSTVTGEWLLALRSGASIDLAAGVLHPLQLVREARGARSTFLCTVPAVAMALAKSGGWRPDDLRNLRKLVVVGAAMPEELLLRLREKLPWTDVMPGYGLTEASPRVACLPAGQLADKPGSAGSALPGVDIRVYRDDKLAHPGEEGDVYVRGPNVMLGYYGDPDRTKEVLTERGLRTMDRGYLDEDGCLYLTGRADHAFNVAGHLFHPETLELALLAHPEVREAGVTGVPDELYGSRPFAYVVAAASSEGDLVERLHEHCGKRLPPAGRPTDIALVGELPRTKSGKLDRFALESMTRLQKERNYVASSGID